MNPLENLVRETMIASIKEHSPELRDAVRAALDRGAKPLEVLLRFGDSGAGYSLTSLMVDWIVDEWEREHGKTRSIDARCAVCETELDDYDDPPLCDKCAAEAERARMLADNPDCR